MLGFLSFALSMITNISVIGQQSRNLSSNGNCYTFFNRYNKCSKNKILPHFYYACYNNKKISYYHILNVRTRPFSMNTFINNSKSVKKSHIYIPILVLLIIFALTGCSRSNMQTDIADTAENAIAWMERPAGSTEYLDGHTVLVSIYMDEDGSSSDGWSDEDITRTQDYLDMACDYLTEAGSEYGYDVKFTYDIYDHPDLLYFTDMDVSTDTGEEEEIEFEEDTDYWIEDNVDYFALMDKYGTDSIGFIYFMNTGGTSWCYPKYHDREFPILGSLERSYLYLYDEYGEEYENPATYAHEILHMFGAVDLYEAAEEDGITEAVVDYVDETYPNDIMYTVYDEYGRHVYDDIPYEIGPLTAYFIGFTNHCDELDMFPQMKRLYKASFLMEF